MSTITTIERCGKNVGKAKANGEVGYIQEIKEVFCGVESKSIKITVKEAIYPEEALNLCYALGLIYKPISHRNNVFYIDEATVRIMGDAAYVVSQDSGQILELKLTEFED